MTTTLVTGAGGAAGVAVIRSLRAEPGQRVIATDCNPHAVGLELAHAGIVLPSASSAAFAPRILEACQRYGIDVLVVTVTEEMPAVDRIAAQLQAVGTAVWLPPHTVVSTCVDKLQFARTLDAAGVATPATSSGDITDVPGPWIVKPREGRGSRDVFAADTHADLEYALRRVPDPIVQTRVAGREFTVDLLVDRDGRIAGQSARWRLDTKGGISTSAVTFHLPSVASLVADTVAALGYRSMGCLQGFVLDDGSATCIEMNPRFGGGVSLSIAAGADFPGQYVAGALGHAVDARSLQATVGTRMTRFFDEVYKFQREAA